MSDNESHIATFKAAFHKYEIMETIEAGIVLLGTEIKSLRAGGGKIDDAYVIFKDHEAYIRDLYIAPYAFGNVHNPDPKREKKLLLHYREILRLEKSQALKSLTIVPLSMYLRKGKVKIKIALAKGKKLHDKRSDAKEKEHGREMARAMKNSR